MQLRVVNRSFFYFSTEDFPFESPFKKCLKLVVFPLWRRDPALELQIAAIFGAIARSSIVLCSSVSSDRSEAAASRLVPAAAACVILLRFAAESRQSHCNGSVRRVHGALGSRSWRHVEQLRSRSGC